MVRGILQKVLAEFIWPTILSTASSNQSVGTGYLSRILAIVLTVATESILEHSTLSKLRSKLAKLTRKNSEHGSKKVRPGVFRSLKVGQLDDRRGDILNLSDSATP